MILLGRELDKMILFEVGRRKLDSLMGLENRNFWAKTHWDCHNFRELLGQNDILPIFHPLFKVAGRRQTGSLARTRR